MLPIPTRAAVLGFAACAAILLLGLVTRRPEAALLAGSGLAGMALCLALTLPLAARLRRERLEFAWWHAHGQEHHPLGGIVVGAPFEIRCYVRNRSERPLRFTHVAAVVPPGVRPLEEAPRELLVAPRTRVELSLRFTARAPGRVVLQGLAVAVPGPLALFEAPLYFPNPLATRVLPHAAAMPARAPSAQGLSVERVGLTPLRQAGGGTELRELREHQPGDPFNAIAWKASARLRKLMVREVEREVQETLCILLDVSGSMRGGEPGARTLDRCIDLVSRLAQGALERGDSVGLWTVDGRVVTHAPLGEGLRHMPRIYDALLRATEVVDRDLTSADAEEVRALVGRYLRFQEGQDFQRESDWDGEAMTRHAARALQGQKGIDEVVAEDPSDRVLRAFCRMRGLCIPYRAETRGFAKAAGLARALVTAAGPGRTPRTLLLISDFEGVPELEPVTRAILSLRGRGHQTSVLIPDGRAGVEPPATELEADLQRVYGLEERRRVREVRAALSRRGIVVVESTALRPATRRRVA